MNERHLRLLRFFFLVVDRDWQWSGMLRCHSNQVLIFRARMQSRFASLGFSPRCLLERLIWNYWSLTDFLLGNFIYQFSVTSFSRLFFSLRQWDSKSWITWIHVLCCDFLQSMWNIANDLKMVVGALYKHWLWVTLTSVNHKMCFHASCTYTYLIKPFIAVSFCHMKLKINMAFYSI